MGGVGFRHPLLLAAASGVALSAGVAQVPGWPAPPSAPVAQSGPQVLGIAGTLATWKRLNQSSSWSFADYAGFLLAHPGWPGETSLRRMAEGALADGAANASLAVQFFRRFPPQSAQGHLRFAEALAASGQRADADAEARQAWRAGVLPAADEARLLGRFSAAIAPADHDARMDRLLWRDATSSAQRQLALTSPARRALFEARLALRTAAPDASARTAQVETLGAADAGFLADRATWLRANGASPTARTLLANRQPLFVPPGDVEEWYEVLLTHARAAAADRQYELAYRIASKVDDAVPAGMDVSALPYGERDDYTSLVWLAGRTALEDLGRPADAIGMFERYAAGSESPWTRAKGYYWAGLAAERAGQKSVADGWYARAAGLSDQFYGQLALERLGRPLTPPSRVARQVSPAERNAFYQREVVRAAQFLGQSGAHEDQTAFVRQIANAAESDTDHILAAELASSIRRPDLGVMVGRSALRNGLSDYVASGYPSVTVPASASDDWTMVHAIARQESQFDRAAVSHAGARGLMQLMPGTAREQSGKLGLAYDRDALTTDTSYNITLGSSYFRRMLSYYGGSYPLAVAAYNAGPGNVNKWLRANGDPRQGVDVVKWVEDIPIYETKNYVQRVLENAVVYDLLHPEKARSRGPANLSWYLGKSRPG